MNLKGIRNIIYIRHIILWLFIGLRLWPVTIYMSDLEVLGSTPGCYSNLTRYSLAKSSLAWKLPFGLDVRLVFLFTGIYAGQVKSPTLEVNLWHIAFWQLLSHFPHYQPPRYTYGMPVEWITSLAAVHTNIVSGADWYHSGPPGIHIWRAPQPRIVMWRKQF